MGYACRGLPLTRPSPRVGHPLPASVERGFDGAALSLSPQAGRGQTPRRLLGQFYAALLACRAAEVPAACIDATTLSRLVRPNVRRVGGRQDLDHHCSRPHLDRGTARGCSQAFPTGFRRLATVSPSVLTLSEMRRAVAARFMFHKTAADLAARLQHGAGRMTSTPEPLVELQEPRRDCGTALTRRPSARRNSRLAAGRGRRSTDDDLASSKLVRQK